MTMRGRMQKKTLGVLSLTCVLVLLATVVVKAYVNFNTAGPDQWLDPGYRWQVDADAGFNNAVCIQWSTTGGASWDRTECQWVGPEGDDWQCTISSNYPAATVLYQFYKDVDADNCACCGNEWEWTLQYSFNTGPNALTLTTLTATSALPPALPALAVIALLGLGLVFWRRWRC